MMFIVAACRYCPQIQLNRVNNIKKARFLCQMCGKSSKFYYKSKGEIMVHCYKAFAQEKSASIYLLELKKQQFAHHFKGFSAAIYTNE